MEQLNKAILYLREHEKIFKTAVIMIIIIAAVFFYSQSGKKDSISVQLDNSSSENSEEAAAGQEGGNGSEASQPAELYIDISGEVRKPGVYKVASGTRLFEVIEKAGGLTEDADINSFNQAEAISDGQKVIIPSKGESDGSSASVSSASPSAGSVSGSASAGLVNINTADSTGLQELPGVGPATAEKIIKYREENGRFTSKEDLMNVSGIGEKTYAKMEKSITL